MRMQKSDNGWEHVLSLNSFFPPCCTSMRLVSAAGTRERWLPDVATATDVSTSNLMLQRFPWPVFLGRLSFPPFSSFLKCLSPLADVS